MTSSSEFPNFPIDDLMGSRLLTQSTLAGEYEAHANNDNAVLHREWRTNNDTQCDISFIVFDISNGGMFSGILYGIELTLTKDIYYISDDFLSVLEKGEDPNPPVEDNLISLALTHKSEYLFSQRAEFGWTKYKTYTTTEYIGDNDSGPIYGAKEYRVQEDVKAIEISSEYLHSYEDISEIVRYLATIADDSLDVELEDVIATDTQLKRAYELLLILQGADENDLDISNIMPAAFLQ